MFDEEDLAAIRADRERWADETLELLFPLAALEERLERLVGPVPPPAPSHCSSSSLGPITQ